MRLWKTHPHQTPKPQILSQNLQTLTPNSHPTTCRRGPADANSTIIFQISNLQVSLKLNFPIDDDLWVSYLIEREFLIIWLHLIYDYET